MARNRWFVGLLGVVVGTAALAIIGCKKEENAGAAANAAVGSKYQVALASLSEADRALAVKQAFCPVSGEPLGSMGTPRKISVQGHEVFVCCEGCESELKDNPDEYLAKLGLE